MDEEEFANDLVKRLRSQLQDCEIEIGKSLLYSLFIDENGDIQPKLNRVREPVRGGGAGFEQDVLLFDRVDGHTSIVPRVVAEVKFRGVTTHDAIVYSEKARRIRSIYPYLRYGMILGDVSALPPRLLRLGIEFDYLVCVSDPVTPDEIAMILALFREELQTSKRLGQLLSGNAPVNIFRRIVATRPEIELEIAQNTIEHPSPGEFLGIGSEASGDYFVYENWTAEHKAVIHHADCKFCNSGKGLHPNAGTRNGKWHGPFASYDQALHAAQGTGRPVRNCKVCKPYRSI